MTEGVGAQGNQKRAPEAQTRGPGGDTAPGMAVRADRGPGGHTGAPDFTLHVAKPAVP